MTEEPVVELVRNCRLQNLLHGGLNAQVLLQVPIFFPHNVVGPKTEFSAVSFLKFMNIMFPDMSFPFT